MVLYIIILALIFVLFIFVNILDRRLTRNFKLLQASLASESERAHRLVEQIESFRIMWKARIRQRISDKVPPGPDHDSEVDRAFADLMKMPVPSDAELIAMQQRGELPSESS